MKESGYVPEGTLIECSCGETFGDLESWKDHQTTHDGDSSFDLKDAHTGREIS